MASNFSDRTTWVSIYPPNGRTSLARGPYTNSVDDEELLRQELHMYCGGQKECEEVADDAVLSGKLYRNRMYISVSDARGREMFDVESTVERNPSVADAINRLVGDETLYLYTVRRREPGKKESTPADVLKNIPQSIQSGGRGFMIGNYAQTFLTKEDAVKSAKDRIFENRHEGDVLIDLEEMHGVLVGMITSGDYILREVVTVTKVKVSRKERQDVYDSGM
ncbi:hypothetical protein BKA66DRAFT_468983 [Pyrenochaeta sp. MPI-SDFR-AT-0127]|nr:hypothetical protein BKA66DRAFT_468983 [Pyrenochaeta sp. MPI-SDFR-AT-0127]